MTTKYLRNQNKHATNKILQQQDPNPKRKKKQRKYYTENTLFIIFSKHTQHTKIIESCY